MQSRFINIHTHKASKPTVYFLNFRTFDGDIVPEYDKASATHSVIDGKNKAGHKVSIQGNTIVSRQSALSSFSSLDSLVTQLQSTALY